MGLEFQYGGRARLRDQTRCGMIPGVVAGDLALLACSGRKAMLYQSISPTFLNMIFGACTFQIPSSWVEDKRDGSITDARRTPNIALCIASGMQLWQVGNRVRGGLPWVQ
jgi:hypothetical protein